jgi:hypothetical protein
MLWELFPQRRNNTKGLGLIKLERKPIGSDPYYLSDLEHRFETHAPFTDKSSITTFAALRALSHTAYSCNIASIEADFITVDTQASRSIREAQSWNGGGVYVIVGVLDELEQELCSVLGALVAQAARLYQSKCVSTSSDVAMTYMSRQLLTSTSS